MVAVAPTSHSQVHYPGGCERCIRPRVYLQRCKYQACQLVGTPCGEFCTLELAFGPGIFVLLLGFNSKTRYVSHCPCPETILTYCHSTKKTWNEGTGQSLESLANECPMLRRVCHLANKNIWSKVVNNEQLNGPLPILSSCLRGR